MRATERQLAEAVTELFNDPGAKKAEIKRGFLEYLKRHHLLLKSDKIFQAIAEYLDEKENRLLVTVTSAHPLDESERKKAEAQATELFPGKHLVLSYHVRPELIGGLRIETKNVLYDATLRRTLQKLAQTL